MSRMISCKNRRDIFLDKRYKKALIIFIDILGSQSREDFDMLYDINNTFHSVLLENQNCNNDHVIYKRTIYTFSDCAYIIYDFKEGVPKEKQNMGALCEVALFNCEPLLIQFLNKGFVFRGGVAYGDVYYEEKRKLLFGPGVNAAYRLESKIAIYPRIVIEEIVAMAILEYWNKTVKEMDNPQSEMERVVYSLVGNIRRKQGCIVKKDFDDIYMMHYLNSIENGIENIAFLNKTNEEFIDACIGFCVEQMQQNKSNIYVVQKYGWLMRYINSVK